MGTDNSKNFDVPKVLEPDDMTIKRAKLLRTSGNYRVLHSERAKVSIRKKRYSKSYESRYD